MSLVTRVKTPDAIEVALVCPECGITQIVDMEVATQLHVVDELDGGVVAKLSPKVKAQKVAHVCRQTTVDSAEQAAVAAARELLAPLPDGTTVTVTKHGELDDL